MSDSIFPDLKELRERVERSTAPDEELRKDILLAIDPSYANTPRKQIGGACRILESVDDALALVERADSGLRTIDASQWNDGSWDWSLARWIDRTTPMPVFKARKCATAPRAVVSALLRSFHPARQRGASMSKEKRFNVVAVNIQTQARRLIAENKSERNADAIVKMAVMRRGVDEEFFTTVQVED